MLAPVKAEYINLLKALQTDPDSGEIVRLLTAQIEKHDDLMSAVVTEISNKLSGPLAIRSSSSMEDLPGHAGAGLYDSVLGVSVEPK